VVDTPEARTDQQVEPARQASSYRAVLRHPPLLTLISGDAISKLGDGMTFVALPVLALDLHGATSPALAVSLVTTAPFVLPVLLSFAVGLGRRRFRPRRILLADCVLRGATFATLGIVVNAGALRLWPFAIALLLCSVLRTLASSSRRLAATAMVDATGRLAVNGLMGTTDSLASYVIGPALGGLITAFGHPGLILVVDGLTYVVLLVAVAVAVPADTPQDKPVSDESVAPVRPSQTGWAILRHTPAMTSLLAVTLLFNLFYGPAEVSIPLLATSSLHAGKAAIGVLWTGFGVGALLGAAATTLLRRVSGAPLLLAIVAGWAASMAALAAAPTLAFATVALAIGGLIYGPYTAVAYTILQEGLDPDQQQPVLTIWGAAIAVALPLGLGVGGPLVAAAGARGGLVVSAVLTASLAPFGARWIRTRRTVPVVQHG
jgi:MFS family permease